MPKLRVSAFSISIDGYAAGPDQSIDHPLGVGGEKLHEWMYDTKTFREMMGGSGGRTDIDDDLARLSMEHVGAWIMGRNMFGPVRGAWPDETWRGWWGDNPPYHVPVFVLTHHPRASFTMEGGTTFHFVTDGIDAALERAREAAGERDIRVGGGASVIRQYLQAGLLDELHLAVSPVLLGRGESLFDGLDLDGLGYGVTGHTPGPRALHVTVARK